MEKEEINHVWEIIKEIEIPKKKKEEILTKVKDKLMKEKTMSLSIKEGAAASVMTGFGESYIAPYALSINANNAQIGFLSSFVGLISPLSQIFGSKLMERYSRKRIIVIFVCLQALMWLPIILLSLLFWKNLFISYLPIILITFYTLYAVFGAICTPAWFSVLGEIVPEKIRGRYFSKRNRVAGIVALVSLVIAAFILDFFRTKGFVLIGFSIIFLIACLFRFISANMLRKHYYPKFKLEKGYYFSFFQFLRKAPKTNFGKFVFFTFSIHFASMIAGPFFAVYMLKDLGFSYITFMAVNIASPIASFLFLPIWGRFADKFGNRELLRIGSLLIPFLPILWILSNSALYLALVPQLIGGVGWAAFNLAAGNFIYDCVSPPRRGLCVAYYNVMNGIGIFLGASLGGLLAQYLSITFMNKLLFIFVISGVLRFIIFLVLMPKVKEVRRVKKAQKNPFVYIKEIKPMRGVIFGLMHDLSSIVKGTKKMFKKGFFP